MPKLYFRYGTVGSAKTLNLLAVAHNYTQQNKQVVLMSPELDTRYGRGLVKSRCGLSREADLLLTSESTLDLKKFESVHCVLVDEAQFLSAQVVDQLHRLSRIVPVICYGLRTDYYRKLFEGSKRLLELTDSIEEVKTTCFFCNRKATFNKRIVPQESSKNTKSQQVTYQQIDLGDEDKYLPSCPDCFNNPEGAVGKP